MANLGGKNSQFEKLFRESIKTLSLRIQYRTDRISAILRNAYNKPKSNAVYWNKVRRSIDVEYRALNKLYATWAKTNIPIAYKAAMKDLFTRLNRSKDIASRAKKSFADLATNSRSVAIQKILVKDAIIDWSASLTTGKANIYRVTRKTQQVLLSEALTDLSVAQAIETGNLMNNTFIKSINMSNTLAAQLDDLAVIIDGEKYVIAGSRRFKPKYYAEMVTRVKFHEAQAAGAIQTAQNYGTSLVQVSSHNTTTEICTTYEGKVYSIGGKAPGFPPLMDAPPYHTNCLHLLMPMFISSMQVAGTEQQWKDFSNGETNKPPSPSNFVPVSEREAS